MNLHDLSQETREQMADLLRRARRHLNHPGNPRARCHMICFAVSAADDAAIKANSPYEEGILEKVRYLIRTRIGGGSLRLWLRNIAGIDLQAIRDADDQLQLYRLRWMNALIQELRSDPPPAGAPGPIAP